MSAQSTAHSAFASTDQRTAASHILDFYTQPGVMTSAGGYAPLLEGLPREIGGLVRVVQGLLLHKQWAPTYGVTLSDECRSEAQIRPVERMLARLLARDDRPLAAARPVEAHSAPCCASGRRMAASTTSWPR